MDLKFLSIQSNSQIHRSSPLVILVKICVVSGILSDLIAIISWVIISAIIFKFN